MPSYDYACASCGPFSVLRPLKEFDLPGSCPQCGAPSPKQVRAPNLHGASPRQRVHDGVAGRPSQGVPLQSFRHGAACACCKPSTAAPSPGRPGDGRSDAPR